jgi:glycine oxidase
MPAQGGDLSSSHHPNPDLAVIGGGAIGLAVAWRAAQRGMRVVVLERSSIGAGASSVAAGMLASVAEAAFGEPALLELNRRSADRWPDWARELEAASGRELGYVRCGTMLVARDRDAAEALERERAFRERLGLDVRRLLPSEARELEPALAPTIRAGLDIPDDHTVDPRRLLAALASAVEAAGGELRSGAEVREIVHERGRVTGVRLGDGVTVAAGQVLVAAGAWSGALRGLPADATVPVRPVKGQLLRLRDPAGPGLLGRVLRTDEAYVVPRGDGRYVLGATVEERGWDTEVTAGAVHDLLRAALEVLPGVAEWELEEASAGLRPGTPDNGPAIGRGALEGLLWATGHYRNGILLCPLTADALAALAAGEPPAADLDPFRPGRFGAGVTA